MYTIILYNFISSKHIFAIPFLDNSSINTKVPSHIGSPAFPNTPSDEGISKLNTEKLKFKFLEKNNNQKNLGLLKTQVILKAFHII